MEGVILWARYWLCLQDRGALMSLGASTLREHPRLMYTKNRLCKRLSVLHLLGLLAVNVVQAFCLTQLVNLHCRYSRLNLKVSTITNAGNGDITVSADQLMREETHRCYTPQHRQCFQDRHAGILGISMGHTSPPTMPAIICK